MTEALTARECEVLELLASGHTPTAIARRLGVTDRTVRRRTSSLFAKLGAYTAAHAVALAYRRGMLAVGPRPGYRLALVPWC